MLIHRTLKTTTCCLLWFGQLINTFIAVAESPSISIAAGACCGLPMMTMTDNEGEQSTVIKLVVSIENE